MKLNTTERKRYRVSNKVKNVSGYGRFRLTLSRTSKNISAQIIDDTKKVTLLSASSVEKEVKALKKTNKTELSKIKSFRPPEPYKGKGIREQGQHILRKEGKKK